MTHLPFVATAYALGALVPAAFAGLALARLRRARQRLSALGRQ